MKDKYEVPKCDCGGELKVERETNMYITNKINKNGTEAKKKIKEQGMQCVHEWLICTADNCNKKYELDHDSQGRVIKCEQVNPYR